MTEFIEWVEFLEKDFDETKREDFFFAELIASVVRSNAKHPERISAESYLKLFSREKPEGAKKEMPRQTSEDAKAIWKARLGLAPYPPQ